MATQLTFLCAGATAASRSGAFPAADEPLDEGGRRIAAALRLPGPRGPTIVSSPSRAAIETARAIGLTAVVEPLACDLDFGDWSGRTIADIYRTDPEPIGRWIADPRQATPGGEGMDDLLGRIAALVDRVADGGETTLVVTHAAPMRAAIAHALSAPLAAVMRIDIAPLTRLVLSHHGQWRLQELRRSGDDDSAVSG